MVAAPPRGAKPRRRCCHLRSKASKQNLPFAFLLLSKSLSLAWQSSEGKCVRFCPLYSCCFSSSNGRRTLFVGWHAVSKQGVGTIQLPRFNLHAFPSPASCRCRRRCPYPYCTARLDARQAGRQADRQSPTAASLVRPFVLARTSSELGNELWVALEKSNYRLRTLPFPVMLPALLAWLLALALPPAGAHPTTERLRRRRRWWRWRPHPPPVAPRWGCHTVERCQHLCTNVTHRHWFNLCGFHLKIRQTAEDINLRWNVMKRGP